MTDDRQAMRDSIKNDTGEQNPTMKWDEPDTELFGTFMGVKPQPLKSGDIVLLATIREEGTEQPYSVWLSSKLILEGFIDAAPAVGTRVMVVYEGKRKTKDGQREFNMFHVRAKESDHKYWSEVQLAQASKGIDMSPAGGGGVSGGYTGPDSSPF